MFDKTRNSITAIGNKQKKPITANTLLEFIGCVIYDVCEHSGIDRISDLEVPQSENFAFFVDLYAILKEFSDLYDANRLTLKQTEDVIADKFPALEGKIWEDKKALGEVSAKIKEFEKINKEKESQRDIMESRRKQLLDMEAKKNELEERIAFLKGPKLDGIAIEVKRLQDEEQSFQKEVQKKIAWKQELEEKKNSLESQLKETTMANTALQKELDEFNRQCKENEYIKSEKESGIADMKKRIADFKKWVSELSENSKKLIDEHNNMNATFQTFMNIWSAVDSQQFLQTTLLGDNPLSDVKDFKGVAYRIDDLQKDIQNRFDVQEGLSRYLKELQRVIEESQNLTK